MRKSVAIVLFGGCLAFSAARGEEPAGPQNRIEFQVKVHSPWLAKLPILKELYTQLGEQAACEAKTACETKAACEAKTACPSGPCPQAIDFAFPHLPGNVLIFSHPPLPGAPGVCQVCPLPGAPCVAEFPIAAAARCSADCPPCSAKSPACECDDCQCGECRCSPATATKLDRDSLLKHILEISTEKAALEAALEAHTSFSEERQEMFSTVAELLTENAKLTAKLEFQGERDALNKQLIELAAQNAHLKAEVELTAAKAELSQAAIQLAVEKERLALRVAELERQVSEGIRTAKAPRSTR